MNIRITFNKNSSPTYEGVIKNCQKFSDFRQDNSLNILSLTDDDLRRKKKTISGIVDRVRDYSDTVFFINNNQVFPGEIKNLLETITCEQENAKKGAFTRNCLTGEGWGCYRLNEIAYNKSNNLGPQTMWYDYGKFDKGDWLIDKEQIREKIRREIKEKHIDECVNFSWQNVERVLATIPNRINPDHDKNWEYKYKESPFGISTQEITGIKPASGHINPGQFFSGGDMSFLGDAIGGLFNSLSNLDFNDFGDSSNTGSNPFDFSDLFGSSDTSSSKKNRSGRSIPNTTFNDIGGMEQIIRQVREVIELPVVTPELLDYYKIKPHKGILLYGPPGCGKTLLAKAVANEINAHFIPISGPEILNKYLGQSEENLRNIFQEAINKAPSIIYFDEFDSIAAHRNEELDPHNARVVNQILTLLDGIDEKSRVCVIASTNRIDMIDEAIKRPGRFDYVLEVSKPTLEGCHQIFDIYTKDMPIEQSFDKESFVKNHLFGLSGAEIAFVATEAAYNSIRRTIDIDSIFKGRQLHLSDKNRIIKNDFLKAVDALQESRSNINKH